MKKTQTQLKKIMFLAYGSQLSKDSQHPKADRFPPKAQEGLVHMLRRVSHLSSLIFGLTALERKLIQFKTYIIFTFRILF